MKRWLWSILAAALLALLVWKVDRRALAGALAGAQLRYLLIGGVLNLILGIGACAARLGTLLKTLPGNPLSPRELYQLYLASSAAHNLLPSPAGEVLRTLQLRKHGYGTGALVGAQLVEKLIEAAGLALLMLVAARFPITWILALLAAGGGALWLVRRRWDALRRSSAPGPMLKALAWTLLSDLVNAATVGLCLAAIGLQLPVAAWLVVVLANRLAGVVPATPGQLGVLEGGIVLALAGFGVAGGPALAFALLYHAVHLVPVTLVGLWFLNRLR